MVLTDANCRLLFCSPAHPASADGWPANPDLGAVDDPGLPAGAEVVDDFDEGVAPDAGGDAAAADCKQGPAHLADRSVIVERSTSNRQASTS
ncbi:hypothetical protein [Streptomyces goshikiensis]